MEKLMCPGCDQMIKVYRPVHDPDELYYENHFLNPYAYTNPGDRGDRCMNSGSSLKESITVPLRTSRDNGS